MTLGEWWNDLANDGKANPMDHPDNYNEPSLPDDSITLTVRISSPWIIAGALCLGLILLTHIIFMCYIHCFKTSQRVSKFGRYASVKHVDFEDVEDEDDSEAYLKGNDMKE